MWWTYDYTRPCPLVQTKVSSSGARVGEGEEDDEELFWTTAARGGSRSSAPSALLARLGLSPQHRRWAHLLDLLDHTANTKTSLQELEASLSRSLDFGPQQLGCVCPCTCTC